MQLSLTRPSHRTLRRMFMTLNVLIIIYSCVSAQPNKMQTCLKSRNKAVYTCEANQMIHVISRLYQEASEDCEVPDDACEVTEDTLSNGFNTDCNGNVTCHEHLSLFRISKICENISAAMITISYECITDPPVNVCSTIVPSLGTHTLYLTSPNYPAENNADPRDRACECDITGTDMSVEIPEIMFLFNLDYRANLTLTGDTSRWESYPNTFLAYNLKAINKTNNLHVMFNAYNRRQRTWLRVKGTPNLMVECNYVQPVTTVTSTTSTETSAPDPSSTTTEISTTLTSTVSAEIVSPGSLNTSAIIGALSGVLVILLLAVAALVIYIKCVKPRRMSTSNSTERGDEAHYENVTDNQGYSVQNDTRNTSENTPADYANLRHYGNMDNVYTGLSTQENQRLDNENSHSNLQSYANDERAHEYSDL